MHGRADFQNPENSGEICLTHQTLFLNEEALKNLSLSRNRNSKPEKKKAERCIHPASIQKMVEDIYANQNLFSIFYNSLITKHSHKTRERESR